MQGHSLGIMAEVQILDGMGRVKRTKQTFLESLFGEIGIKGNRYPMRSFVGEFLGRLLNTFTNGIPSPAPGIFGPGTYNADKRNDYGLLLGCDTTDEIRYVSPSDTAAGVESLIMKPSDLATAGTDGLYGATGCLPGFVPVTIDGYPGIKFSIWRTFTNGTSQRVIREVFLVGKTGAASAAGTKHLYSRDNYAPLTALGSGMAPRGEVIQVGETLMTNFDLLAITKKGGMIVHNNFFAMLFNSLFVGNKDIYTQDMQLSPIAGDALTASAASFQIKSGANVDDWTKAGLDIKLHSPSFAGVGYSSETFALGTSGGDPGLVMEQNSEFPNRTLTLNDGVGSVTSSGKNSIISIEKVYSGHTAPFSLMGASLVANTASGVDAQRRDGTCRLVSWQKKLHDDWSVNDNEMLTIGVDDNLKVQFQFVVNCGDYTYTTAQNVRTQAQV